MSEALHAAYRLLTTLPVTTHYQKDDSAPKLQGRVPMQETMKRRTRIAKLWRERLDGTKKRTLYQIGTEVGISERMVREHLRKLGYKPGTVRS